MDDDVAKNAFLTPFGHFQRCVLSFGLSNARATFQRLMKDMLYPFIDVFLVVHLDAIWVFSKSV